MVNEAVKDGQGVWVFDGVKVTVGVLLGSGVALFSKVRLPPPMGVKICLMVWVCVGYWVSEAVGEGPVVSDGVERLVWVGVGDKEGKMIWVGKPVGMGVYIASDILATRESLYRKDTPRITHSRTAKPINRQPALIRRWRLRKYGFLLPVRMALIPAHREIKITIPVIRRIANSMS